MNHELSARLVLDKSQVSRALKEVRKELSEGFAGLPSVLKQQQESLRGLSGAYAQISAAAKKASASAKSSANELVKPYQEALAKARELQAEANRLRRQEPSAPPMPRNSVQYSRTLEQRARQNRRRERWEQGYMEAQAVASAASVAAQNLKPSPADMKRLAAAEQMAKDERRRAAEAKRQFKATQAVQGIAERGTTQVQLAMLRGEDSKKPFLVALGVIREMRERLEKEMAKGAISEAAKRQFLAPFEDLAAKLKSRYMTVVGQRVSQRAAAKAEAEAPRDSGAIGNMAMRTAQMQLQIAVLRRMGQQEETNAARKKANDEEAEARSARMSANALRRQQLIAAAELRRAKAPRLSGDGTYGSTGGLLGFMKNRADERMGGSDAVLGTLMGGLGAGGGMLPMMAGAMFSPMVGLAVRGVMMFGAAVKNGIKEIHDFYMSGMSDLQNAAVKWQNNNSQTGMTRQFSAQMGQVASQANVDPNAFALWWNRFQANIGTVGKIAPTTTQALAKLNLPIAELRQLRPEEQLERLASAFAKIKDPALRASLNIDLFNRQGGEMDRIWNNPNLMKVALERIGKVKDLSNEEIDALAFVGRSNSPEAVEALRMRSVVSTQRKMLPLEARVADQRNRADFDTPIAKVLSIPKGLGLAFKSMFYDIVGGAKALGSGDVANKARGAGDQFKTDYGRYPDLRQMVMGENTSWSKIGAFSSPGFQSDKTFAVRQMEYLQEIAANTRRIPKNLNDPKQQRAAGGAIVDEMSGRPQTPNRPGILSNTGGPSSSTGNPFYNNRAPSAGGISISGGDAAIYGAYPGYSAMWSGAMGFASGGGPVTGMSGQPKPFSPSLNLPKPPAISGGRASGGPVQGGKSYIVGEAGPEIFVPTQRGEIISNRAAKRIDGAYENGTRGGKDIADAVSIGGQGGGTSLGVMVQLAQKGMMGKDVAESMARYYAWAAKNEAAVSAAQQAAQRAAQAQDKLLKMGSAYANAVASGTQKASDLAKLNAAEGQAKMLAQVAAGLSKHSAAVKAGLDWSEKLLPFLKKAGPVASIAGMAVEGGMLASDFEGQTERSIRVADSGLVNRLSTGVGQPFSAIAAVLKSTGQIFDQRSQAKAGEAAAAAMVAERARRRRDGQPSKPHGAAPRPILPVNSGNPAAFSSPAPAVPAAPDKRFISNAVLPPSAPAGGGGIPEIKGIRPEAKKPAPQVIAPSAPAKPYTPLRLGFSGSMQGDWSNNPGQPYRPIRTGFAGAREKGGPAMGGMNYLVGESGPEMFVPNSSGSIVPNHMLGGGGGGGSLGVNRLAAILERIEQKIPGSINVQVDQSASTSAAY